jgi:mannosyltransferase OCH1-like enzyme
MVIIIIIIVIVSLLYYYYSTPKLNIIQTWKDNRIPIKYLKLRNQLKKHNPHANYIFFTDNDIEIFIKTQFPQYINFFNNLPFKIQKIDFFRYLAVYYYGGVYFDLDYESLKPLSSLFNESNAIFPVEFLNNTDLILRQQGFKPLIGNYAFYAPKNHPFLKLIIDNIVNNRIKIKNNISQNKYVYYTTGPVMVTQSYLDFKDKLNVDLIKPNPFKKSHFGIYGKHMNMGSWK